MRKFLSILICIMSCFLIVGCGSSSKMNGTWVYKGAEPHGGIDASNFTLNSGLNSFVIKNGNTIVIDGKSSELKKYESQYYLDDIFSVSFTYKNGSGNAEVLGPMYYDETDDIMRIEAFLGFFTADLIYTRQ